MRDVVFALLVLTAVVLLIYLYNKEEAYDRSIASPGKLPNRVGTLISLF
ncbi:hypothetical protein A2U01_0078568, partial [Trifolium medium]|nr:hypothetical protein [Trifolium medium]